MVSGKTLVASFSDAEALALLKPGLTLFNSPGCPIGGIPEQFTQPSEVQTAYDSLKAATDAAHPNDGKQIVNDRRVLRRVFDETAGSFVDLVVLGSRKDPSLPAKFSMEFLGQGRAKTASKSDERLIPYLILQAIDKEPGTVRCKVRGGVKKGIEIHHAYDDPSNERNWQRFDSYVNGTFSMPGLLSGRRTYVRGRYVYSKGQKGPWSEMVSIMVP